MDSRTKPPAKKINSVLTGRSCVAIKSAVKEWMGSLMGEKQVLTENQAFNCSCDSVQIWDPLPYRTRAISMADTAMTSG